MTAGVRRPLKAQRIADPVTAQVTDRVRQQVNRLSEVDILNGVHIGDTELPDAENVHIVHRLGRKMKGYIVTDLRGAVAAGYITRTSGDDARELVLIANAYTATVTVRLWVY